MTGVVLEELPSVSAGPGAMGVVLEELSPVSAGPGATALLEVLAQSFTGPGAELTLAAPLPVAGPASDISLLIEIDLFNLVATVIDSGCVQLSWDDVGTTEDGYRVERSLAGEDEWVTIGSVEEDTLTFLDEFAVPLVTYDYRVFSFEGSGDTHFSLVVSASTPLPPDVNVGPPPVAPEDPPRNRIKPDVVEFKSPGNYGLERDVNGNVTGFKY